MRKTVAVLISAVLIVPLLLGQASKTEPAQKAAESWIALVDAGNYAGSYDQASTMFKAAISKADWVQKVGAVRTPLGKTVSRKLQSAQYTTSLPGAPDGEYVVARYDTSFENKKAAIETVVMAIDKDGQWRVSGYFIK